MPAAPYKQIDQKRIPERDPKTGLVIIQPQQLEFGSLAFPRDRTMLYVHEVAEKLNCHERHVRDLLEEGQMIGIDIGGKFEYMRIPTAAISVLAARFRVSIEAIMEIIADTRPDRSKSDRCFWRIPVKEGYEDFLSKNNSLAK